MNTEEKLAKILEIITPLATKEVWSDRFDEIIVDDYAGGNIDDAFYGGQDDGETQLARRLLEAIKD